MNAPHQTQAQANATAASVLSATTASRKKSKRNRAGRPVDAVSQVVTRSDYAPHASSTRPKAKVPAALKHFIATTQPQARPKRKRKRVTPNDDYEEDDASEPFVKKNRPDDSTEPLKQTQDDKPAEEHEGFYKKFKILRNAVGTAFANYREESSMEQRRRTYLNQNNQMQRSDYSPGSFWGIVIDAVAQDREGKEDGDEGEDERV